MKLWIIGLLALPFSLFATERVISIGGDVTEIVYALGAQQALVARDSTSLQPPQATALPNVGYMRQLNAEGMLAMTGPSGAADPAPGASAAAVHARAVDESQRHVAVRLR